MTNAADALSTTEAVAMSDYDPLGTPTSGAASPVPGDPGTAPRPTRAELRRAREAGVPVAAAAAPAAAPQGGRAASRNAQQQRAGRQRPRSVLTAWWLVPLLVLIAAAVYLGVKSATPSGVQTPGIVVSTAPASP